MRSSRGSVLLLSFLHYCFLRDSHGHTPFWDNKDCNQESIKKMFAKVCSIYKRSVPFFMIPHEIGFFSPEEFQTFPPVPFGAPGFSALPPPPPGMHPLPPWVNYPLPLPPPIGFLDWTDWFGFPGDEFPFLRGGFMMGPYYGYEDALTTRWRRNPYIKELIQKCCSKDGCLPKDFLPVTRAIC